jgi:hypothetical protein
MSGCIDVQFTNEFNTTYARNNKSKLKKNVRCFPQCCEIGHSSSQFCGQSVNVKLTSDTLSQQDLKSLLILGCFGCNKDAPPCVVGENLPESELRSIIHATNMIQGTPITAGGVFSGTFVISSSSGWNYLNSVNQTRGQACHTFQVFSFSSSADGFLCQSSSASPPFQISSTKRSKKHALKVTTEKATSQSAKRPRQTTSESSSRELDQTDTKFTPEYPVQTDTKLTPEYPVQEGQQKNFVPLTPEVNPGFASEGSTSTAEFSEGSHTPEPVGVNPASTSTLHVQQLLQLQQQEQEQVLQQQEQERQQQERFIKALCIDDTADTWFTNIRKGEHMRCLGMDKTLRASFDKIASEQVLLEQYLDTFVGDGAVAIGDDGTKLSEAAQHDGAPEAAPPNTSFSDDTQQPCSVSTLQLLFECVYSPSGVYNQVFRRQITALARSCAEQLQQAKQVLHSLCILALHSLCILALHSLCTLALHSLCRSTIR